MLTKESLKLWGHKGSDIIDHTVKSAGDFLSYQNSLLELYRRRQAFVHIHVFGEACSETCISAGHGNGIENGHIQTGEEYPPMLVDVRERVQTPEGGKLISLPAVVRLQKLDFCNRLLGNPLKEIPLQTLFEGFRRFTDRKSIIICGTTIRGKTQFPYKVVQCGSEVLEDISDKERDGLGDGGPPETLDPDPIKLWIYLGDNEARATLKVPSYLGVKRLAMFFCPEDFARN